MLHLFLIWAMLQTQPPAGRQPVPVLCYHNITAAGAPASSALYISGSELRRQMKALADSGYTSIRPGDLYNYLVAGSPLPNKPVLITFDDSHLEHFSIAAPVLEETGFRGTFFVMTVTIGKKGYLSAGQIADLHKRGHAIGCHTWDHPHISGEQEMPDAAKQLRSAKSTLEKITGAPVRSFAYPFGAWNEAVVAQLQENGFQIAFQLSAKKMGRLPWFTVRRILVDGKWDGARLQGKMREAFQP